MENNKEINKEERAREIIHKSKRVIYYILGVLEVIFAFRLFLKLLGANPASGFVSFVYTLSGVFIAPFNGIFRSAVTKGIETKSVLEPTTIIAMIVYAIIAWGIVKLIELYNTPKDKEIK